MSEQKKSHEASPSKNAIAKGYSSIQQSRETTHKKASAVVAERKQGRSKVAATVDDTITSPSTFEQSNEFQMSKKTAHGEDSTVIHEFEGTGYMESPAKAPHRATASRA